LSMTMIRFAGAQYSFSPGSQNRGWQGAQINT
jgi:hypothetical protein